VRILHSAVPRLQYMPIELSIENRYNNIMIGGVGSHENDELGE
jgi:hypothetical protein